MEPSRYAPTFSQGHEPTLTSVVQGREPAWIRGRRWTVIRRGGGSEGHREVKRDVELEDNGQVLPATMISMMMMMSGTVYGEEQRQIWTGLFTQSHHVSRF